MSKADKVKEQVAKFVNTIKRQKKTNEEAQNTRKE